MLALDLDNMRLLELDLENMILLSLDLLLELWLDRLNELLDDALECEKIILLSLERLLLECIIIVLKELRLDTLDGLEELLISLSELRLDGLEGLVLDKELLEYIISVL